MWNSKIKILGTAIGIILFESVLIHGVNHANPSLVQDTSTKSTIASSPTPPPTIPYIEPTGTPTPEQAYSFPTNTPTPYPDDNYMSQPKYNYNDIPTPQPVYQPHNISCITNGSYTTCSDGSSSYTNGNFTTVNGGMNGRSGSCITNEGYTTCSDGSSAINSGNASFVYGNGRSSTCFHNGNMTSCN